MSMMLAEERKRRVIGIASTGWPIYTISGSEGEKDGDTEGKEKEKEGEGTEGADGSGTAGDGGSATGDTGQPAVVSREEHEQILRRLAAADAAKGELDRKLRAIDDKDKSELEKAQRDLAEAKEELDKAKAAALQARLANEILKFPGYVWHDPEAVLRLVDMEMISVDGETNKVTGVKEALAKLARDKAYLLKGKGGDQKGNKEGAGNGASGHNPAGSGDTSDKNKKREELVKKYKLH
jgi:hypothetical protein